MGKPEKIKRLMEKRTRLLESVSRFGSYLHALSATSIDLNELDARINKFKDYWHQFHKIQSDLESLDDDASYISAREEFETNYFKLLALAKSHTPSSLMKGTNSTCTNDSIASNGNNFHSKVRLPKIELPSFSGLYEDWYNFHDTFNSLIHSNDQISSIEKFHYLKSALKDEAAEILHSLEITEANYESAWEMLRERYDNKRVIINKHIQAIFDLPVLQRENHTGLRQILDGIIKHVRALTSLQCPTPHWDHLLVYIIKVKLDPETNKAWESTLTRITIPTLKQMTDFLSHRCQVLNDVSKCNKMNALSLQSKSTSKRYTTSHFSSISSACSYCNKNHNIQTCDRFQKLSVDQRYKEAKVKRLCINCLSPNHNTKMCKSNTKCKKCGRHHNSLLHFDTNKLSVSTSGPAHSSSISKCITADNLQVNTSNPNVDTDSSQSALVNNLSLQSTSAMCAAQSYSCNSQVLLSTAKIHILDINGSIHECRALLDSGSQACFITEEMAKALKLKKTTVQIPVLGISQSSSSVSHTVQATIKSKFNSFTANIQCLVLRKITENLPLSSFPKEIINIPKHIKLADPEFNISNHIDILIGAEIFWNLLCVGQIKLSNQQPIFQKTHFGWIISGPIKHNNLSTNLTTCNLSTLENSLNANLKRFWQLEEGYKNVNKFTKEESECENHFLSTFKRDKKGRFIVELPIKFDVLGNLGDSRQQALKRFYSLERKFDKQPESKEQYIKFISEYENLGHMRLVSDGVSSSNLPSFYLPHHAVIKQSSVTTKLRVVFDGSAKTSSGISINDCLKVGPVIQQDLFSIVLRFRSHQFVITGDIAKMYRQVLVSESHTKLQRILWRPNKNEPVKDYELLTVTYGTAPASFLAIRALHQLAEEEKKSFSMGSRIIQRDFYVDDLLSGANSIEEAARIRDEVNYILQKGGFELRKWSSNCPRLLNNMSNALEHAVINIDKNETIKTLGLQWNSLNDSLSYKVPTQLGSQRITKRSILSCIAQIFDPLGLIGPVIITAKILMQDLWQLNLSWDESVPININSAFRQFQDNLKNLASLKIPRWISSTSKPARIEIHGFCDASELAYGASVYIRVVDTVDNYTCNLLCAKSKVAPLKNISLPRLELCGALLLARLLDKIKIALEMPINQIYIWTDSTIVLSWIKSTARTWKTFVANRVAEIQDLSDIDSWHHVSTEENPADIISRGISSEKLINNSLWWHGPKWLLQNSNSWRNSTPEKFSSDNAPERRIIANISVFSTIIVWNRFSDFNKLVRVTAYCLRYINNFKIKHGKVVKGPQHGPLSSEELAEATSSIIKLIQGESFSNDIKALQRHGRVNERSDLFSLNPFLDDIGVIRVGGRLRNSSLPFTYKHQIVLPKSHYVTKLITKRYHQDQLHAGCQATLAAIRVTYWPIGARNTIKKIIRACISCYKVKPAPMKYIMGDLPADRVTSARPFINCGVDYFGPLYVRESKRRNAKLIKAYGAIFICFSVKAVHIELVTDLSTASFLGALKRFTSRRGKPSNIYSDNGTNFVGANNELEELRNLFISESSKNEIITSMASSNINWHFIPPRSPHFGGLWEAAVKSFKHHIRRVAGNASLHHEEMYTLLVQIEAILNSRPLTPLSSDPNDFSCLTPGHFLIGDFITAPAEPNLTALPINRLSRWQHVENIRQHFWQRWQKEYVAQLQERCKWKASYTDPAQVGQLVLVRDENLPPLRWLLGRIDKIHPGADGIIRTATIRTAVGTIKRACTKLCPLPVEVNN